MHSNTVLYSVIGLQIRGRKVFHFQFHDGSHAVLFLETSLCSLVVVCFSKERLSAVGGHGKSVDSSIMSTISFLRMVAAFFSKKSLFPLMKLPRVVLENVNG